MGKVLTRLKVFADEGVELSELLERVKKVEGVNSSEIQDYVFGTKIIVASFVCDDKEPKDFEEIVSQITGVSGVQVEEVGLVS